MAKVLMVTTVAVTLEAFLLPFARAFREKGWAVDAAASGVHSSEPCMRAFGRCYELSWTRNPLDLENLLNSLEKIRILAERNEYDLVHVHTPIAAFVTRYALRKLRASGKVKVVYTAHGFHFYRGAPRLKSAVFKIAEKIAAAWTDHLIVINEEDYMAALRMLPEEKVTLIAGGVGMEMKKYRDAVFSGEELAAARAEMGAGAGDTLVLMIAEFVPRKRHRDLINALALTGDASIRLAFAGTGALMEETRRLAEAKGVADRIKFLGFCKNVPLLIAAADAAALPSEQEGLPRSVMESMARGTPVIGTDIRGIRDMLAAGCGTLVPLGDAEKLAAALKKHKTLTPELTIVREKAKEKAAIYDVREIIKEYEKIYERLLD